MSEYYDDIRSAQSYEREAEEIERSERLKDSGEEDSE